MKKIILQHWTGELNELCKASSANISKYAKKLGAEYKLLLGDVFQPGLSAPMQKLHMLDEIFDEYDIVVMLDADMFVRKGMEENIFDLKGVGMFAEVQERIFKSLCRKQPNLTNPDYPYWGGATYVLDRETRQKLRAHININELRNFSGQGNFEDEGSMHRLATLAQLPKQKLPGRKKWCHGSFEDGIEQCALIHIRTKISPKGPKRDKIVNYKDLVNRGLIEE
jgi:hypothetical protein